MRAEWQHWKWHTDKAGKKYLRLRASGKTGARPTKYSKQGACIERFSLRGSVWGRVDLLSLASDARTSVEMVEPFYSSNLAADLNIRLLQGRRE